MKSVFICMKSSALLLLTVIIFSCKKEPNPLPDITTGLVVNIPLNGGAYDSISGVTGVGYFVTPILNRHGETNMAMQFNRNDSSFIDFGDLPLASFPNNIFSICCWYKVPDTATVMTILSKRGVYGPGEYSLDNHFSHNVFNLDNWIADGSTSAYGKDPLKASAPIETGTWQHIVFVADGTSLKVYVNGTLQNGSDDNHDGFTLSDTDMHFILGNGGGYGQNYFFNGSIDDVRIYNIALEESVIKYLSEQ